MATRKTDPEPFPVRGTPTGYRDRWDSDDSAIIQALNAERERLIVAARESAATVRRGKGRVPGASGLPASPADRIVTDPETPPGESRGGRALRAQAENA